MRTAAIVPAYQAESSVGEVVRGLVRRWPSSGTAPCVVVIDDGSTDRTALEADRAGALVIRHPQNYGKGRALRTGLAKAHELGFETVVSVDADGQHPPAEAVRLALSSIPPDALVLGVRDLERAGAPPANRFSNQFSNLFISLFAGRDLNDTQCGLRRYPVARTLALGCRADGYGFEAEVILRAARAGLRIFEEGVEVIYPSESERVTHFHSVRDPAKIVARVLFTVATAKGARP